MTEFAIITFLVAVGTIGVVGLFGNNLRHLFGASGDALAGATTVQNGGTKASAGLLKWSMKGSGKGGNGNPGGSIGAQPEGNNASMGDGPGGMANGANPGGSANMPGPGGGGGGGGFGGGNPGGSANSENL